MEFQREGSTTLFKLFLLQSIILQAAAHVPTIIVFGDSTVDPGNNNVVPTLLRSNFNPYGRDFPGGKPTGRFCNGKLPTDFISEAFGLKETVPAYLDPDYGIEDFAVGVSFASAGTGLDNATADVLGVIPLWKEVEYFKEYIQRLGKYMGRRKAQKILREALYLISMGTNDFLENYYTPGIHSRSSQLTVDKFEDFLLDIAENFLREIYRMGARKISFSGLSLMGCLPMQRTTNPNHDGGCIEEYNRVAQSFNVKLHKMAGRLRAQLPGIRLVVSDLYDHFQDIFSNPSKYGFDNVETGCCSTGMFELGYLCNELDLFTCADANKYAFWDASHPSEMLNKMAANHSLCNALFKFLA